MEFSIGKMTPDQDWENLDFMTEEQAKVMLRLAISKFRIIYSTMEGKDFLSPKSYTSEGHQQAIGLALAGISEYELHYHTNKMKALPTEEVSI